MTASFGNHLFFLYPILLVEFTSKDIVPIETVIAADFITVGLSVFALDFTTQQKMDIKNTILKQFKNPALIGLALGLITYHSSVHLPESTNKLINFICASGVPLTLLSMGILLSYKTDTTQMKTFYFNNIFKVIWLLDSLNFNSLVIRRNFQRCKDNFNARCDTHWCNGISIRFYLQYKNRCSCKVRCHDISPRTFFNTVCR